MGLLVKFEQAKEDSWTLAESLDSVLQRKLRAFVHLRESLHAFRDHIKQEECLNAALTKYEKAQEAQRAFKPSFVEGKQEKRQANQIRKELF